jgi:hypothetical protein
VSHETGPPKTRAAKVHKFFASDLFRNCASASATLVSTAALIVSIASYHAASSAQQIQREMADRQGDMLSARGESILLNYDGLTNYIPFRAEPGTGKTTNIPIDKWQLASGKGGQKIAVITITNRGHQDAHFSGVYLKTDASSGRFADESLLQPRCGELNGQMGECPKVIAANDGLVMAVELPDEYVARLDPQFRPTGIVVCVVTGLSKSTCATIGVAIPAGALR